MADEIYTWWLMWLLAFTRILLVFVQAPIFGSHHIPRPLLVGVAATMTFLVFPSLPVLEEVPEDFREMALWILTQIAVGLVIGYVSFLIMAAAQFGGEMLDIQMGLSVAASFDPASHGAINLLRRLHFYIAMLLYLVLNGHHMLVEAIFHSFRVIPLNHFYLSDIGAAELIRTTGEVFVIGTQIAAPALGALFITQVALGLLARVAPQMNVFMLSFPLNIAIGVFMISVSLPLILKLLQAQFDVNLEDLEQMIHLLGGGR